MKFQILLNAVQRVDVENGHERFEAIKKKRCEYGVQHTAEIVITLPEGSQILIASTCPLPPLVYTV